MSTGSTLSKGSHCLSKQRRPKTNADNRVQELGAFNYECMTSRNKHTLVPIVHKNEASLGYTCNCTRSPASVNGISIDKRHPVPYALFFLSLVFIRSIAYPEGHPVPREGRILARLARLTGIIVREGLVVHKTFLAEAQESNHVQGHGRMRVAELRLWVWLGMSLVGFGLWTCVDCSIHLRDRFRDGFFRRC
jgi:hypothetical protein